jgi:hypothetical protein
MMAYNTRKYWVFGLCPLSGILKITREHNVFGNWMFPSSGGGGGDTYSVGSVRKS